MRVLLLTGENGVGKDFIANRICGLSKVKCDHLSFAAPVRRAMAATFSLPTIGEDAYVYDRDKDKPSDHFFGSIPRTVMESFSEKWLKYEFGPRVFGDLMLKELHVKQRYGYKAVVISDHRFLNEVIPLQEDSSIQSTQVVNITRKGTVTRCKYPVLKHAETLCTYKNDIDDLELMDAAIKALFLPYIDEGKYTQFDTWSV